MIVNSTTTVEPFGFVAVSFLSWVCNNVATIFS